MLKKIFVANWKMNGSLKIFDEYLLQIQKEYNYKNTELIIAPPFPYINYVKNLIDTKIISLAGQTAVSFNDGARTGDVNCRMLSDVGCNYVILGHSECRVNHNFDNIDAAKTVLSALNNNLNIIFCVGEEKSGLGADEIIVEQVVSALEGVDKSFSSRITIAYEPVWAIGTGLIPETEQILDKRNLIFATLYNLGFIDTKIIYGGSVNVQNMKLIMEGAKINGFIVGKACMDSDNVKKMLEIMEYAENIS